MSEPVGGTERSAQPCSPPRGSPTRRSQPSHRPPVLPGAPGERRLSRTLSPPSPAESLPAPRARSPSLVLPGCLPQAAPNETLGSGASSGGMEPPLPWQQNLLGMPRAVRDHSCSLGGGSSCRRGNPASRFLLWTTQIPRQSWVRLTPGCGAAASAGNHGRDCRGSSGQWWRGSGRGWRPRGYL